ncbi:glycosyltransferase [Glutamicibacter sp. JL.03c]|uniref:glycosyltransferase n=1 Tax=Glutamicibacter sp. JL.03c TaxID=2984842 RepID=UPI0021F6C183|nr:glycosyltransferase [Glutamicibacter sp. JL.03c]UYQ78827.1 glycosyltransferase [Glutamicibacter sp. JL.03c]
MKILSIIPDIGPGGLTGAVLNRISLLAEAGNDASVVLYQFMPNFRQDVESKKQQGQLNERVHVHNPYDYFEKFYSTRKGYTPERITFPYQYISHDSEEVIESYFDDSLLLQAKVFRSIESRRLNRIQFFDESSTLRKEEFYFGQKSPVIVRSFRNGSLTTERYLSRNGFCYLRQEVDPTSGKFIGFWSWTHKGDLKFYKSIWDWRRDFVKNIVCKDSAQNVILCDGNNVPPQFLRMKSNRFRVVPIIHMNHRDVDGKLRRHYSAYFDRINEFDSIICLTDGQATDLKNEFSVEVPIFVIPNRIRTSVSGVIAARNRDYDAVLVSRLEPGKGVGDAVRAFRHVVDKLPDAKLEIFGSGSEQELIEGLISQYVLSQNVKLRGATNRPLQEMANSKVFMFTSESEGFGLTIAESLSSGTPVVSFDCKYGPASLIDNSKTGFLVNNRDIEQMAGHVIDLLENDSLLDQFSLSAMEWFSKNLSDNAILNRWLYLFSEIESN